MKYDVVEYGTKVLLKHMRVIDHVPFTSDVISAFLSKFAEESDDAILLLELKIFKTSVSVLLNRNDERMLKPVSQ
jgi:hypothetical protein